MFVRRFLRVMRPLSVLAFLWAAGQMPAAAQPQADGLLLGMSEPELRATFPGLVPLRKPVAGPRGARGLWSLANVPLAGLTWETLFFMTGKRVSRIEQGWSSSDSACSEQTSLAPLVATLDAKYGQGLASVEGAEGGHPQRSVLWVAGPADVAAYFAKSATQCSIRLIYLPHLVKDASEL